MLEDVDCTEQVKEISTLNTIETESDNRLRNHVLNSGNTEHLVKAYFSESDRYSGLTTDNFDGNFMLFTEKCGQKGIA